MGACDVPSCLGAFVPSLRGGHMLVHTSKDVTGHSPFVGLFKMPARLCRGNGRKQLGINHISGSMLTLCQQPDKYMYVGCIMDVGINIVLYTPVSL